MSAMKVRITVQTKYSGVLLFDQELLVLLLLLPDTVTFGFALSESQSTVTYS